MKHLTIIILVLALNASAQNTDTYLVYDPITKTVRFNDKHDNRQNNRSFLIGTEPLMVGNSFSGTIDSSNELATVNLLNVINFGNSSLELRPLMSIQGITSEAVFDQSLHLSLN